MVEQRNKTLPPSTVIGGKYEISEVLGIGGMGTVYQAVQLSLGRHCAVKLLHPHFVSDEIVLKRFHREAQAAAAIGHDNICEVTDFGETDDGAPYLVMPLLSGLSFAQMLDQGNGSMVQLVDIICQVLSALDAAHEKQIIHRDLKPENIFITQLGDRENFAKLLDFGISKFLDQSSITALSGSGILLGTPFYMAPEQAKGDKDLDHRVDIYAMGVILYEALTGHKPFSGESWNEVFFKVLTAPYTFPSDLLPDIAPELEGVILKAMDRDPAGRFETAGKMREALLPFAQTHQSSQTSIPAGPTLYTKVKGPVSHAPTDKIESAPFLSEPAVPAASDMQPPELKRNVITVLLVLLALGSLAGFLYFSMMGR